MIIHKEIPLNDIVTQVEGNIVSDMDGEKVMLNVENGKYYNLGEIGGEIWDLIKQPITIHQLVSKLVLNYEVEQKVCEEQVLSFLKSLNHQGLITLNENTSK